MGVAVKSRMIKSIRKQLRPVKGLWLYARGVAAKRATERRFHSDFVQTPHTLSGELIISLTSYTPRFTTILPTLQCLLTQSVKPDRVILWLGHKDMEALPESIRALTARGLEIRATEDVRSHTKLIPALTEFPDAFIVTADDDSYYGPDWLKALVAAWDGKMNCIVCHSAHRMRYSTDKTLLLYNDWQRNLTGPNDDADIFPLGFGGIFYPPRSLLRPEVLDKDKFMSLSSGCDDLWFFWMGRRNGAVYKQTGYNKSQIIWPSSQEISLGAENTGLNTGIALNDEKIAALVQAYGLP